MSNSKVSIFLCHSSTDKASVQNLRMRLQADGFEPWLDEENLLPGQDWQAEIKKAIRSSDVVLVCLSPTSVTKDGFVQKEIRLSLDVAEQKPDNSIFLIPVLLEHVQIPDRLAHLHCCDIQKSDGYRKLLKALNTRAAIDIKRVTTPIPDRAIKYHFDGSAFGVMGEVRRPKLHTIPTQAATVLIPRGSRGKHRVLNFQLNGVLSFKIASVEATGVYDEKRKCWSTKVISIIKGLTVAEILTATRIVTRLEANQGEKEAMPRFTVAGTFIENLRIAGYPVELELNSPKRPEAYEASINRYAIGIRAHHASNTRPLEGLHTSLVSRIKSQMPMHEEILGVMKVPTIGVFRFAELVITPGRQSLTMLRATLNNGAEFTIGGVSAGGHKL